MYYPTNITGLSIEHDKTLCLTFDDGPGRTLGPGPGPRTEELALYLAGQGVSATFFVTGMHAELYPDIIARLRDYGHLVANHTYNHPNLTSLHALRGDLVSEVSRTDRLIANYIPGNIIYFRAPYLAWLDEIADILNANLLVSLNHVGPIGADIFLHDYDYWVRGETYRACIDAFYREISAKRKGIVLLHDNSAGGLRYGRNSQTLEVVKYLVPKLIHEGYSFIRLDEIPEIRRKAQQALVCGLKGSNGKYISVHPGEEGLVTVDGPRWDAWERLYVEYVSPATVAIRTDSGTYLSPQNGGGSLVLANGPRAGLWEQLSVLQINDQQFALRTIEGYFLTRENAEGGRLMANVDHMRAWEVFTFENHVDPS